MCEVLRSIPRRYWFALQTRSRHEKVVRDWLASDGYDQFLPTMKRLNQWTDRKKWIEVPLFSGFCFARFSPEEKTAVLRAPGVVRIVGTRTLPEPIPDEEIDAVKRLAEGRLEYEIHPYLVKGMFVEVIKGPLTGLKGRLIRKAGKYQIVIGVSLIQQAASVQVSVANVAPIR